MPPLREHLYAWLAEQELWQQDLAKRLAMRSQLTEDEYEEALRMVKTACSALADSEAAVPPQPLQLGDLPAPAIGAGASRLVRFGRLRGVGALSEEHELTFAPDGLTIIYGQNAAGKTTYVRALKRVCRTVDLETQVRGNVYAESSGGATATVEFVVGSERRAQQIDLRNPPNVGLDAISVFDSRCAELYLNAQNAIAYVPSTLLLLARLAATQDRMRADLQAEIGRLSDDIPRFPDFSAPTQVKAILDTLSAKTSVDSLLILATLDEPEQLRLAELRAVVASAQAQDLRPDADAARQDAEQARGVAAALRDLVGHLSPERIANVQRLAAEVSVAREAAELAAQEFAALPISGVGTQPWRRLWQAAREFAQDVAVRFPPSQGDRCPLCMQEVAEDAAARFAHFETHVNSALRDEAERAEVALRGALAPYDGGRAQTVRTPFFAGLADRDQQLHADVEALLTEIEAHMAAIRDAPASTEPMPIALSAVEKLEAWAANRASHGEALRAALDPQGERALREELAELDARERLAGRVAEVMAAIAAHQRIAALREARTGLATNRITIKQRELSDLAVTGVLEEKLRDELRSLRCEHLPVVLDPRTAVGETQVGLRLAGATGAPRVSDIASEGEQRALSLSFFLAEVATSESDGGVVIDDPVSSLDDERRAYIADRLVAEAQRRQVVVLTHDLPFMLDLVDQAERTGLEPSVQGVWRFGAEVGRVDDHPPFKAMRLRDRLGVLSQRVQEWNNQPPAPDFDTEWRRVRDFYADLRTAWERAVEERLFKGVVQRFQREVKTLALDSVVITPKLVEAVKAGMTRCSQFVHDEPPGTATSLPGRVELAADLQKLRDFFEATK